MSEHEDQRSEATLEEDRDGAYDQEYVPGGRRRKGRGLKGCLAVLVALVVLLGGFYVALTQGVSWVSDQFQGPDDYPGPGRGSVEFTVNEGDTVAQMGRNLKEQGVTKSVQAFIDAAAGEPESSGIQVGAYELQKQMKASDALEVLIDPANLIGFPTVTIPEGLRLTEIVSTLAENTDFTEQAYNRALQQPDKLGLPDYAGGNAEGYLFPATYEVKPGMKPARILAMMVDRWRQAAEEADLEARAAELGHTPGELMIIASLIEAEGRGDDMPKISRVIYNRLDGPGDKGGTNGTLGIDASIAYGLGLSPGSTELTPEQLAEDTPYNTRINAGLPPTPIEAPGDDAIEAAANPADGGWYYYVTVDLSTGETKFYEDYDGFLEGRDEYKAYCETSDRC
ncbi:endolytic transglycosylase MltG [Nocardioides sp. zg-1308]|uniref:Endolytic murein transglycosylase n=1 Tax=Nocardioides renjunii TaxID=3095075 RepID=A0ABU5KGR2_9ACTN|nr:MULTISPECIES: endolytic transglycosylase MltG [unclassified Nocardioides]MDZ5663639.1 endolytic transglycosylase MltG [Nocardioides sp. S-58]NPD06931.1 endolytic transglycosylase MltG [Nocardioides sp. zg-1308]